MLRELKTSILTLLGLVLVTGLLYPLAVMGIAQLIMPDLANGSLISENGKPAASRLIGRQFTDPKYFWPRLSATGPAPYNGAASSGSNYGPLSADAKKAAEARVAALRAADPANRAPVPADLATASGSGLDPDISPEAALYQVPRVARLRQMPEAAVRKLVNEFTQPRQFGLLGEPRVNVLLLNRQLDKQSR